MTFGPRLASGFIVLRASNEALLSCAFREQEGWLADLLSLLLSQPLLTVPFHTAFHVNNDVLA